MRPVGFSTGALAYADFQAGLDMTVTARCPAIELSALRQRELEPLLAALAGLDLSSFSYISIHAPSQFEPSWEPTAAALLWREAWRGWPIVMHPDALRNYALWRPFGATLCIENMDKRKPVGRSADELASIFSELPDASLCFDIGHARQVDPTMTEARFILREFNAKLRQVHISEVNTQSTHDPLSHASILAFERVAHLIPESVPLILETPTAVEGMEAEIRKAREALPVRSRALVA